MFDLPEYNWFSFCSSLGLIEKKGFSILKKVIISWNDWIVKKDEFYWVYVWLFTLKYQLILSCYRVITVILDSHFLLMLETKAFSNYIDARCKVPGVHNFDDYKPPPFLIFAPLC